MAEAEDDPLSKLMTKLPRLKKAPLELYWDLRVFGLPPHVPVYITLSDALEMIGGDWMLNIPIIQLYMDTIVVEDDWNEDKPKGVVQNSADLSLRGMTSSSGKRMKTMASKRKEKEPEQPHSSRFLSRKHEKHFKVVQDRRLLMERKVGMIPNFAPQFGGQWLGNDWGKLATSPTPANIAVVKEFYTNARKIGDYPAENYLGYVRGHAIRYDPDSINNFLDTVWAGEQCQFALCMEEGADFDDVERVLCVPGGHYQRNRTDSVVKIRRTDLTPLAKYWMAFSHANIQPCSHVSDITLSRALLLYCAIRNLNVNIGQVIADEIRMCANTTNNKAPLGHPSLITHLFKIAGVDTSAPPFESPRKAIDEAYYRQYYRVEEAAQPVPARRTRRERGQAQGQASAETHEGEPFQMRDMYMSLIAHRWTMEEFHNVVAWPEEQVQGDRAEAAEASAMEMEEDEADDDEDDAFEDAEDEEEEEDIDDSSD
ncbi:hypothetical protein LR48_Vigan07g134200 [Vigna angularis]|uniref:Putative plant transposon protein domain-containing protein n=1 Tax=Phaseolus angularis TaxID=3914 RepID=A0A0L9UXY6_PHAAN|nr:hypothetical protein LR48_Vigan07g134200 [Vigna angularis]